MRRDCSILGILDAKTRMDSSTSLAASKVLLSLLTKHVCFSCNGPKVVGSKEHCLVVQGYSPAWVKFSRGTLQKVCWWAEGPNKMIIGTDSCIGGSGNLSLNQD